MLAADKDFGGHDAPTYEFRWAKVTWITFKTPGWQHRQGFEIKSATPHQIPVRGFTRWGLNHQEGSATFAAEMPGGREHHRGFVHDGKVATTRPTKPHKHCWRGENCRAAAILKGV
jgi:hypothetical protein